MLPEVSHPMQHIRRHSINAAIFSAKSAITRQSFRFR
jgi:hypothetical protein